MGPVQGGAIGLHLLSGLAIVADNRRRVVAHRPTSIAVVAKTALTGAALAASAAAYKVGADLGEAMERADHDPRAAGAGSLAAVAAVGDPGDHGRNPRARRLPR